jgi:hypothetical protein
MLPLTAVPAAEPPDLSKVDRRIAKEPAYVCKQPLYGLYVFGPKATTRVWAVFDKSTPDKAEYDVLYFDRNANGDLTESSKRIVGAGGSFRIGDLADPATGDVHTDVNISRRPEPDGSVMIHMKWKGKHDLAGGYSPEPGPYTQFTPKPADAPVMWPGAEGPLSFEKWTWNKLTIGGSDDLRVFIGHQGVGKNTFCGMSDKFLPQSVPVLATVIYTDGEGKERRAQSELRERC